jgi:polyhydroxyalkanoate synthase
VTASRDTICPPDAAEALNAKVSSADQQVLTIPGGHVGAVVGSKAPRKLYPAVAEWLKDKVGREVESAPKKPASRSRSTRAKKSD